MTETALYATLAGLFGLLIGSFLNVCIYRWTRDLSVVKPRSSCTSCERMITWYDNVPVLSFVLLKGQASPLARQSSRGRTSKAVELLTALFFAYFVAIEGLSPATARDCLFAALMIGLIFSDLDTRLLPDEFTVGGLGGGAHVRSVRACASNRIRALCRHDGDGIRDCASLSIRRGGFRRSCPVCRHVASGLDLRKTPP